MTDAELRRIVAETSRLVAENSRDMKLRAEKLDAQIGALHNKWGSYTEGLALPSMTKLLQDKFHMEFIAPRATRLKGGESMELDVFAYNNGKRNQAVVVEVKSHAKMDAIDQLKRIMKDFPKFYPEHRDKDLFGIIAAVDISQEVAKKAMKEGFYVARISDETFKLQVPAGFRAHSFKAGK